MNWATPFQPHSIKTPFYIFGIQTWGPTVLRMCTAWNVQNNLSALSRRTVWCDRFELSAIIDWPCSPSCCRICCVAWSRWWKFISWQDSLSFKCRLRSKSIIEFVEATTSLQEWLKSLCQSMKINQIINQNNNENQLTAPQIEKLLRFKVDCKFCPN